MIFFFSDLNRDLTLQRLLVEIEGVPWNEVQQSIEASAAELELPKQSFKQQNVLNTEVGLRYTTAGTQATLSNPANGYDSSKLNPFQPYFQSIQETINPATGSLVVSQTDLTLPGRGGLDLEVTRVYSSNSANFYKQLSDVYMVEHVWVEEQIVTYPASYDYWPDGSIKKITYDKWTTPAHCQCPGGYWVETIRTIEEYWPDFGETQYTVKEYVDWRDKDSSDAYNYTSENTYLDRRYDLGVGWSLSFPSVEVNGSQRYLHLGDGRVFLYNSSSPSGLYKYPVKDLIFKADTGYPGTGTSSHSLTLTNGIKYYFNSTGYLLGIIDRYGNTITFTYESSGNKRLTKIEDTVGRTVSFSYSDPSKVVLTIKDKDGSSLGTLQYHLVNTSKSGKKKLEKVTDLGGRETFFAYAEKTSKFCYRHESTGSGNEEINYYLALTKITHPFGLSSTRGETIYDWEASMPRKVWIGTDDPSRKATSSDYQEYLRISKRSDRIGTGSPINVTTFTYIPWASNSYATVRTMVSSDSGNVEERLEYNKENLLVKQITKWNNPGSNNVVQTKIFDYVKDLPAKETISYGSTEKHEFTYGYDEYGNLTYLLDNLGKEKENFYYYEANFQLPKETRERKSGPVSETNQGLWHITQYTLTSDKLNIEKIAQYEAIKQVGIAKTFSGPTSGDLRSGDQWSLTADNSVQFDLTIYRKIGLLGGIRYVVEYREVGSSQWTIKASEHYTTVLLPKSSTVTYNIGPLAMGRWEVQVRVTAGSLANITTSSYKAHEIQWIPVDETKKQVIQYEYSPQYKSNVTAIKVQEGSDFLITILNYETKYSAYLAEIVKSGLGLSSARKQTATYDSFGRIKTLTESENSIGFTQTFDYDAIGRLTKITQPVVIEGGISNQYFQEWIYDDQGAKVTAFVRNASQGEFERAVYTFDPLGRRVKEERMVDGLMTTIRELSYNDKGLVVQEKLAGNTPVVIKYTYDPLGRLLKTIHGASEVASPRNFSQNIYTDGVRNKLEREDTNGVKTEFLYDRCLSR